MQLLNQHYTLQDIYVRCITALIGAFSAIFIDTAWLIVIATLMILGDCLSAARLASRMKKAHGKDKVTAKFQSKKFKKVVQTTVISWGAIVVSFMVYSKILLPLGKDWPLHLYACGIVAIWQGLSILENESSCNGSKLAVILQKIVVDKTERHFDVDLSSLKNNDNEVNSTTA